MVLIINNNTIIWSKSNNDFCEINYINNKYIAEYYNTISNIPQIFYTLLIIKRLYYDLNLTYNEKKIYISTYLILLFIFIGSALFHSTLLYITQLLDELPMLLLNINILYLLNHFSKFQLYKHILIKFIVLIIMFLFNESKYPLQISYILFNILILKKLIYLLKENIKYSILIYKINRTIFYYAIAAIFWILDEVFCTLFRKYYLHSYWHIFSYIASLYLIEFSYYFIHLKYNFQLPTYYNKYKVI